MPGGRSRKGTRRSKATLAPGALRGARIGATIPLDLTRNGEDKTMAKRNAAKRRPFGATFKPVSLAGRLNWPGRSVRGEWWQKLAEAVRGYPEGAQTPWGIPFEMAGGARDRVVLVRKGEEVTRPAARQGRLRLPPPRVAPAPRARSTTRAPAEGLVVAEYELTYSDGSQPRAAGARALRGRHGREPRPGVARPALPHVEGR